MKYGLVPSSEVCCYPDNGDWFIVHSTRSQNDPSWIQLDDAIERFAIIPVIARFGAWAVTDYGIEHFASYAKLSHHELLKTRHLNGWCNRILGYWEKDWQDAVEYALSNTKKQNNPHKLTASQYSVWLQDDPARLLMTCAEIAAVHEVSTKTVQRWETELKDTLQRVARQHTSYVKLSKVHHVPQGRQQAKRIQTISGVYLLNCEGHYKIGRSRNVTSRVKQIQTNAPYPVEHVHTIVAASPERLESELHTRYANKRIHLEWFQFDAADVAYICSL